VGLARLWPRSSISDSDVCMKTIKCHGMESWSNRNHVERKMRVYENMSCEKTNWWTKAASKREWTSKGLEGRR
jgi:hypothetical protein